MKMPVVNVIKIIKGFVFGFLLLSILYLYFLNKIGYLEFKWKSTSVGICGRTEYGIRYEDKIIIKVDTKPDNPCL